MMFGVRYNRSMPADENNRKANFHEFLDSLADRPNSKLLTEAKAKRIRMVLRGCPSARAETARFRFYVKSKGFSVVDLPLLGLSGILCAPAPKVSCNSNYVTERLIYRYRIDKNVN